MFTLHLCFGQTNKPKLVVGIVVDQMRTDYLSRYQDKFIENGFKRLLDEGFYYKNAHFNYTPTYTGPGHASIYTGSTPSRHGIISNNWFEKRSGNMMYCAEDTSVIGVGGTAGAGLRSPKNMVSTTVTDELILNSNFKSKVVGISIKDRGAILPAGHNPNGAYWYDPKTGEFMTSSYYMNELPKWVSKFNKKKLPKQFSQQTWNTLLDIKEYTQSTADDSPYEYSLIADKPVFPYNLAESKNGLEAILNTPFGNDLILELSKAAVNGERLGKDEVTDFLAVSFSSTDYAGHKFGTRSIEIQDIYLRLDRNIAELLQFLDENVGSNEYVVFLTADHGVVDVPSFLMDNKFPAGYISRRRSQGALKYLAENKFGKGDWIRHVDGQQLFLNRELIKEKGLDLKEFQEYLRLELLANSDEISEIFTSFELGARNMTDPIARRIQNGYNATMSGDLFMVFKPAYLGSDSRKGTSHGSPYNHDTNVPVIFYGKNIPKGYSVRPINITDIAPTISMYLDIPLPNAATGIPLDELFYE